MPSPIIIRLKKHEDRRLRNGNPWIYSNEVDVAHTPLSAFTPGQAVVIENHEGRALGAGYINPHSLICVRLLSRDPTVQFDKDFFSQRIQNALKLRERLFSAPFYRLVFGESDGLPGLVIDRYGDVLVLQITAAGMDKLKDEIRAALLELLQPKAILMRNDVPVREIEKLTCAVEPLYGEPPQKIELSENNARFSVPIWSGQKTGWFYDQRTNRASLLKYVKGKRVLDVFCYLGAWSIQAALHGASEVQCVDSSAQALEWLQENATLNNVQDKIKLLNEDAFKALVRLHEAQEKFDVIILDPPAFVKKRKDFKEGFNAYRRLNELAMRLLTTDGILISASCSMHLQRDDLRDVLSAAACRYDRTLQIIEQGHQAPDHPIHPAIPETDYLKAFVTRVVIHPL